jgi:hypothetical protein
LEILNINKSLNTIWWVQAPGLHILLDNFDHQFCCVNFFQNISCVHGPAVMELMWGIQHCMHSLVPKEVKELTEADRLPMSRGLHTVLSRYCCVVKQEMVS